MPQNNIKKRPPLNERESIFFMQRWRDARGLRTRWKTEDGRRRLSQVVAAVVQKRPDWEDILKGFSLVDEVQNGRDLRYAQLGRARLSGAYLADTELSHSDLSKANLSHADLRRASLSGARMVKANLASARIDGAFFTDADIRGTDLTSVVSFGKGGLPASFGSARFNGRTSFLGAQLPEHTLSDDPLLKRHIEDERWLKVFAQRYPRTHFLWRVSSNCGRSFSLWASWSLLFALYFGLIYHLCGFCFETTPGHTLDGASWLAPLLLQRCHLHDARLW